MIGKWSKIKARTLESISIWYLHDVEEGNEVACEGPVRLRLPARVRSVRALERLYARAVRACAFAQEWIAASSFGIHIESLNGTHTIDSDSTVSRKAAGKGNPPSGIF